VTEIVISVTPWILGAMLVALIAGLAAIAFGSGGKYPS
jgi:hypothetical protein